MSFLHLLLLTSFFLISALIPLHTIVYAHLILLARRYRTPEARVLPRYPHVTIQLPIYNERHVVRRLVRAVTELDYPREMMQIILADDSDDETSRICGELAEHYRRKGFDIIHLKRPDRWGYKAGALQNALNHSKGEFIAIFDADFLPPSDFLKKLLPYFADERVGVVQARWGHLNRDYSLLTSSQALALDLHFMVEQRARHAGNLFLNFNGTAGIWRKTCIVDSGGWIPSLAEDLDLSYRAQLKGWKIVYVDEVETPAEIPVQMNAIRKQQYRWAFGAVQTAIRYLGSILRSSNPSLLKIHAVVHLTRHIPQLLITLQVFLVPLVVRSGVDVPFSEGLALMALYPVILVSAILIAASQLVKKVYGRLTGPLRDVLLLIVWATGISLNNAIAVVHAFFQGDPVFDRTPKFGIVGRRGDWRRSPYALSFVGLAVADILMGGYSAYAALYSFYMGAFYFIPLTALFSISLLSSGLLTINHSQPRIGANKKVRSSKHSVTVFTISLIAAVFTIATISYVRTGYQLDLARGYIVSASDSVDPIKCLSNLEEALKIIPGSGNPVWPLPTPSTDLSLISDDLKSLKERLEAVSGQFNNVELYHSVLEDIRQALKVLDHQLRMAMPYFWAGYTQVMAMLLAVAMAALVMIRR